MPQAHTEEMSAVLLAGGRSSRMGQDKALLEFNGVRLIDRAMSELRQLKLRRIIVSGRDYGFPWVKDSVPDFGPLGGLYSVIHTLGRAGEWWLVIPVDMPLLGSEILNDLILQTSCIDLSPGCECIRYFSHEMPVLFRNTNHFRTTLDALCLGETSEARRSFHVLESQLNLVELSLPSYLRRDFSNINHPEQWKMLAHGGEK
jgi:molybdopterin-guanine dinucleotide biosynthesis protein A